MTDYERGYRAGSEAAKVCDHEAMILSACGRAERTIRKPMVLAAAFRRIGSDWARDVAMLNDAPPAGPPARDGEEVTP